MVGLPKAISPTQRTPAVALAFDFLASSSAVGSGVLRALVIAPLRSGGTLTAGVLQRDVAGASAAGTLFGPGGPGHLACKRIFEELPLAAVDVIATAAPSGASAAGTFVFDDNTGSSTAVTVAQTVTVWIAGRTITIQWLPGEDKVAAATKLVAAINALASDLPGTATNSSGTSATVTFTFCMNGAMGNDVQTIASMSGGTGGSFAAGGTKCSGGSGEISIATALTAISGASTEYDYIVVCTSNADASSASSTSNPGRLKTHFATYGTGANAKLQQAIIGHTSTLSSFKTATAALNIHLLEGIFCRNGQSLPYEWAGAECGQNMRERAFYAVKNRIRMLYKATLYGPYDHVTDDLSAVELEDALQHGITPIVFDSTLAPAPLRPITMYWQDSGGAPDDRILDKTRVDGIFEVAKDVRVELPRVFSGKNISPDLPTGDDELPPDVVEIGTVRAFFCQRLRKWQGKGVLRKDKLDEAIGTQQNPGTLIVAIDDVDEGQVNAILPLATVRVWAKSSLVFTQAA